MTQDTFYKWVIDCPDNVPQELIEYIMNNNELSDVEIDADFITFDTYGEIAANVDAFFNTIESILINNKSCYYMEAVEYISTGEYLSSESDYYEES